MKDNERPAVPRRPDCTAGRFPGQWPRWALAILAPALLAIGQNASAELDLANVERHRLANGLTVLLLVDRNFPVVSVQMLYRVGARNETTGKTGLAHFVEHMAFRSTDGFPGTDVVSRIYAVGGEWHGYTWTDQTTYFATVPKAHWPLLLEIEADRMARLTLDPGTIDAERGAVFAEMHQYELDPDAMLVDALAFASFTAHPYRNNTIGWESDIDSIVHADVAAFYDAHYHPANGVLAVVGDVDSDEVLERIDDLFGSLPAAAPTPPPHTIEPLQQGERRAVIRGSAPGRRFRIGYRAPAVNDPDYAAFLVLQELLAGSSGVSFLQNDWGTPARPTRLLYGAADDVSTWYPPSAQDYLFAIGGRIADGRAERDTEDAIEAGIATLREAPPSDTSLAAAIESVLAELVFDVQTTEDAAHQLAFFEGLGALDVLLTLPERVRRVTPADVRRTAVRWLDPDRRSIVWYRPGHGPAAYRDPGTAADRVAPAPAAPLDEAPAGPAELHRLGSGLPVIVRPSDLSPGVALKVIVPALAVSGGFASGDPDPGYASWTGRAIRDDFAELADAAAAALQNARRIPPDPGDSTNPPARLERAFAELMALRPGEGTVSPALIVVAGDVDAASAVPRLDAAFGSFAASTARPAAGEPPPAPAARTIHLDAAVAQSRLGYAVAAPAPTDDDYYAWRLLQYIVAHDYEGRLGKAAISERGLAYYIDAGYRSAGSRGWVTLATGVDTEKLGALESLMHYELERLRSEPPGAVEVAEAKRHLVGRAASAAQSNEELAGEAARSFLRHGELPSPDRLARKLDAVSVGDVVDAVPAFTAGVTIRVVPNPDR